MSIIRNIINESAPRFREATTSGFDQSRVDDGIMSLQDDSRAASQDVQTLCERDSESLQRLGNTVRVPNALPGHLPTSFNPLLAEILLRDGSLLLDRCVQSQKEYNDLSAKWFEARVQIEEMLLLNSITTQEENAIYDIPAHLSNLDATESTRERDGLRDVSRIFGVLVTDSQNVKAHLVKSQRDFAWAQADRAYGAVGVTNPNSGGGPARAVREFADDVANASASHSIDVDIANAICQERTNRTHADIADLRRLKELQVAEYKGQQAQFQRRRNEVARLVALRRANALITRGGELNYDEQRRHISVRFRNDLFAAWLRLSAAAEGLTRLYGYPEDTFPQYNAGDIIDFETLVTWAQMANVWLSSFQDQQQVVTRSFSLKQLIGEEAFAAGTVNREWNFTLRAEDFDSRRLVRMRGFSMQVASAPNLGSWNVVVNLPASGRLQRSEESFEEFDQRYIDKLYLGRINERTYAVIPENAAPPRLYNASPIGSEWKIQLIGTSTAGSTERDLNDLDIHLSVALV